MEQSQLVQRAVQRLRDGIARRETTLDLEAIKAVLVEMAIQKERADTFERRVVKAELASEEMARRIGDQSGRLATVAIERDGYSKVINELTKQIQERDARLAKAMQALREIAGWTDAAKYTKAGEPECFGGEARKVNDLALAVLAECDEG
jgi:vacuolar-type H+-ATPase subunit I/STV1